MNYYPSNLHKYESYTYKEFLFEIPELFGNNFENIKIEEVRKFYQNRFNEDFKVIYNGFFSNPSESSSLKYIQSLTKLINNISVKLESIYNFHIEILRLHIGDIFGNSVEITKIGEELLKRKIGFDYSQYPSIVKFIKGTVGIFLNELNYFKSRIEKYIISTIIITNKSELCNSIFKIPDYVLYSVFSFLCKYKLITLNDGKIVTKTLAAKLIPFHFNTNFNGGEKLSEGYLRKQCGLWFVNPKKGEKIDERIQKIQIGLVESHKLEPKKIKNPNQSKS